MRPPKTNAMALRIYGYAQPLGWNCTMGEVAQALGVHVVVVAGVAASFGWTNRFRVPNRWQRRERDSSHGFAEDTRETHRDLIDQFAGFARGGADE